MPLSPKQVVTKILGHVLNQSARSRNIIKSIERKQEVYGTQGLRDNT